MKKWAVLAALSLASCAQGETIYMADAKGQPAQCGPYRESITPAGNGILGGLSADGQRRLRTCVSDYEKSGFHRVPGPASR